MDLRLSLSPSGPPQKCRAQPAPHPQSGTRMGHRGQRAPGRCITQHEAPRARGWAQPAPYAPLWSLVFLFAPRGLSTWQRKRLWNGRVFLLPGGAWTLVSEGQC